MSATDTARRERDATETSGWWGLEGRGWEIDSGDVTCACGIRAQVELWWGFWRESWGPRKDFKDGRKIGFFIYFLFVDMLLLKVAKR